jgi:hypothetical protein
MMRSAFASLFALAMAAGAAQANPVGGGSAAISGGGDNLTVTYNTGGAGGGTALVAQSGRLARFAGSQGDGQIVEYTAPAPASSGREAWLVGGGDNAEVVYVQPR